MGNSNGTSRTFHPNPHTGEAAERRRMEAVGSGLVRRLRLLLLAACYVNGAAILERERVVPLILLIVSMSASSCFKREENKRSVRHLKSEICL